MSSSFRPDRLDGDYAYLESCPEGLLPLVVGLPLGSLQERVVGIVTWRNALLAGSLPAADSWPGPAIATPTHAALEQLGVVPFCRAQPQLVDALLPDLIESWRRQSSLLRGEGLARLKELVAAQSIRRDRKKQGLRGLQNLQELVAQPRDEGKQRKVWDLPPDLLRRLRAQADLEVAGRPRPADAALLSSWAERCAAWHQIAKVFGDLGHLLGRGLDFAAGILRQTGWHEVKALRELVAKLPELREVVRTLGRLRDTSAGESIAESILRPVRRVTEEQREIPTPEVPGEVRGIDRSGEISRMLASESVLLGHPKLRLLWHARRAERALLTYRVEGVMSETVLVETEVMERHEQQRPRPERGPIIAVIDTSGSMHGLPERIAKALVLEAACTAHAEKRQCLLFLYGSRGEVLEQELSLDADGIPRLLEFLSQSFGGGTDIEAMHRVLHRLGEGAWKKADVLLASDGQWSAGSQLVQATREAAKAGTRFHGILIGSGNGDAMAQLCSPVHAFNSWAAMVGERN